MGLQTDMIHDDNWFIMHQVHNIGDLGQQQVDSWEKRLIQVQEKLTDMST